MRRAGVLAGLAAAILLAACTTTVTQDEIADREMENARETHTPCAIREAGSGCLVEESECIQDPAFCKNRE